MAVVVRGVGTLPQLASSYVLLLMHGVIEVFVAVHTIHHLAGVLHLRSSAVFFSPEGLIPLLSGWELP